MLTFNLDLDYVVLPMDRENKNPGAVGPTNESITHWLIQNAVGARFPQTVENGKLTGGVSGTDKKIWTRLLRELNRALVNKAKSVQIDETTFDWIRETIEKWQLSPGGSGPGWLPTFEEYLDQVKLELAAQKNGAKASEKVSA